MNKILAAIYQHALTTPKKIALTGQTTQLTYAELAAQIDELAHWISEQNIGRAGLWGENSIEWIVADLAAWKVGITLVPLPRFFSHTQLQHVIAQAQLPCLLVCGDIEQITDINERKNSPIAAIYLDTLVAYEQAASMLWLKSPLLQVLPAHLRVCVYLRPHWRMSRSRWRKESILE